MDKYMVICEFIDSTDEVEKEFEYPHQVEHFIANNIDLLAWHDVYGPNGELITDFSKPF